MPSGTNNISLVTKLATCFSLGNFTDNFFKQVVVLLAAGLQLPNEQAIAAVLFSLPFVLFSSWAGWIADHYSKKTVVVAAKSLEFIALSLGCYSLFTVWWDGILLTVFLMGVQSTFFSPALNGSIPENFERHNVPRINALIKLSSTVAMLLAVSFAGLVMDLRPGLLPHVSFAEGETYGRLMAGSVPVIIAIIGLFIALALQKRPASVQTKEKNTFPWSGPVASLRHFFETRNDGQLFTVLLAEGFFYGIAVVLVLNVVNMATELGFSKTTSSFLSSIVMVGIAVGAIFAGRFSAESWRKILVPALVGISIFLFLAGFTTMMPTELFQLYWLSGSLFLIGVCGGFYLIPLASFIQVRPKDRDKGKILGVSNFFSYIAITLWGVIFLIIKNFPTNTIFFIYAAICFSFALLYVQRKIRQFKE